MSSAVSHVSKRDLLRSIKLDDDAVGELLTISRSIVNMLELLSGEPESQQDEKNNSKVFASHGKRGRGQKQHKSKKNNQLQAGNGDESFLQRVHASVQVDHFTVPSLFPSMLQKSRSTFDQSSTALSRTLKSFHVEPDAADMARCALYSGEVQRQLQAMFTLGQLPPPPPVPEQQKNSKGVNNNNNHDGGDDDEAVEPLRATGVASQPAVSGSQAAKANSSGIDSLLNTAKLLCRKRGTTAAPSSPNPSNEIMLTIPAVRVRHNRNLNPIIATLTPTHLHVRDPIKDVVQKLPWSHLTSCTLGNAPGLHASIGGSNVKQSLANVTVGPRHGLLWMMARNEAQQTNLPMLERKKLALTPSQALNQSHHCVNLQFSGMSVVKDSPIPVDASRMTSHHVNELWRFEIVCECEDDFALFCTFVSLVGSYQSSLWAIPALQPWTIPQTRIDRPPRVACLKLRPTTLSEIDAAVPGGLSAWSKQQDGSAKAKSAPPPTIAMSEAFFRMAHTDKYARPVTLRYSTRAEIPTGFGSSTTHVGPLNAAEIDFCTANHIGRVEYVVMKQLMLGDPLNKWISIADVLGHMMVPLRAWNISPAVKMLKFWCELGWLERVLVLEPGPRKK